MPKTIEIPIEYKRLFDTDWREAAIYGGRYSLKSHTVARYLLIEARTRKTRVGCFREFQSSIAESSHQLLADLIKLYELDDFVVTDKSIVNKINGSDFLFKGLHRNEQNVKSTEGIDIAWVEEAQTISSTSLEILTPTVRKEGSRIIYTYNRLFEEDPVHKRLVIEGRQNTLILNLNFDVALKYGYMPKAIQDEMEDDKANRPSLYKHKWLGEPYSQELKVYKGWNRIEELPHEARLERIGLDFGYTNDPTAIVGIYKYNGGYILDEICFQKGMSNKEIAETLKNSDRSLVIADSAEPKSIDEIRLYGINILPAEKGQGSIFQGIQYVQNQKISVTARSYNIWKEYQSFVWKTEKDGKVLNTPDSGFDHSMDAIRYAITSLKPKSDDIAVKLQTQFTRNAYNRPSNSTR
jgi:phage terminase large subunit